MKDLVEKYGAENLVMASYPGCTWVGLFNKDNQVLMRYLTIVEASRLSKLGVSWTRNGAVSHFREKIYV